MRNALLLTLLIAALATSIAGCQSGRGSSQATPSNSNSPVDSLDGFTVPRSDTEGASSGGGGYVSENSELILERAKGHLAARIRGSTSAIFSNLPKPWTQEMLAKTIENVRYNPDKTLRRDDKDLMFNYGTDEDGPFIEALYPFFFTYGAVPVKLSNASLVDNVILDVELKLAHEVAHHFVGGNDDKAELFGLNLLSITENNFLFCETLSDQKAVQQNFYKVYGGDMSSYDRDELKRLEELPPIRWLISPWSLTSQEDEFGDRSSYFDQKLEELKSEDLKLNSSSIGYGKPEWKIDRSKYPKIQLEKILDPKGSSQKNETAPAQFEIDDMTAKTSKGRFKFRGKPDSAYLSYADPKQSADEVLEGELTVTCENIYKVLEIPK